MLSSSNRDPHINFFFNPPLMSLPYITLTSGSFT